jgi:hypothetical protein
LTRRSPEIGAPEISREVIIVDVIITIVRSMAIPVGGNDTELQLGLELWVLIDWYVKLYFQPF